MMASNLVFDFRHHYETGERRASEPCAYQYDQGHIAKVYVPETADEFEMHYAWGDFPLSEGYTVDDVEQADDGGYVITAHIPNDLFERSGELRVYVVASDTNSIITTYEGYIFVKNRVQPDDYVDDDPDNHATKILDEAQRYATKSESFAVGGTGTRLGEDTDNAKYYLEQAKKVAESIPEDYSELSDDVVDLKDAVFDQHTGIATKAHAIYCTTSGSLVTIPDGADSMPLKSLTVAVEAVQSGSGDPSPTNVRPISGWTGCKIPVTGKNIFGGTLLRDGVKASMPSATINEENKTINFSAAATVSMGITQDSGLTGKFKENTPYTFIITFVNNNSTSANLQINYTDGTNSIPPGLTTQGVKETIVFTTPASKTVLSLSKRNSGGTTILYYEESGIFEGTLTADDFVPYEGNVYDITFPSEAGTVYGAKIDPVNGTLSITHIHETIDTASRVVSSRITVNAQSVQAGFDLTYNRKKYNTSEALTAHGYKSDRMIPKWATAANDVPYTFRPSNSSLSTAMFFTVPVEWTTKSLIAENMPTFDIVYPLINPIEITLDPVTIRTLLGLNNIWADTGSISECVYAADTKMYIEELTKPSEDDMVANAAIEAGKFFMIGNRLFLSTASIANGATITPGTNATELSLAEALNSLN